MKQDERIDTTLKALTQAKPPGEMEQRILHRLEAHRSRPIAARRWLIPVTALGACALVALIVETRHPVESPAAVAPTVTTSFAPSPMPRAPRNARPLRTRTTKPGPAHPEAIAVSYPAPPAPLTEQEKLLVRMAQAHQRAMTTAPSMEERKQTEVALTHEEKLLVAVSHVRQDAVLDALDPVRRAEADAREKRAFNAYVQQKDGGS